ncbi:MAG: hypothetical protein KF832_30165 [Caldilineaceae bacterium]|nr:hypothetical protein [Caldilineaceae bacterium]
MESATMIELTEAERHIYQETAKTLKGSERRIYMARIVQTLGHGGQRYVERTLGWNRRTIRKGLSELQSGIHHSDRFSARGRKRIEERLPHLLTDLGTLIEQALSNNGASENGGMAPVPTEDGQHSPQHSPQSPVRRFVLGLSVLQIRRQLREEKAYSVESLPCVATIRKKLAELGYILRPAHRLPRSTGPAPLESEQV